MARDVVVYLLWVAFLVVQVRFAILNVRARHDWTATAHITAAVLAAIHIARQVA